MYIERTIRVRHHNEEIDFIDVHEEYENGISHKIVAPACFTHWTLAELLASIKELYVADVGWCFPNAAAVIANGLSFEVAR
jgi:3-dehydroquinate dehydratase